MELLEQFRCLAHALNQMHHYTPPESSEEARTLSPIRINEPTSNTNWRHGDVKPGNILRFTDPNSSGWLGTLKLGDLGRARQHNVKTQQRKQGTREKFGSWRYEAPETFTALEGRSRLYDIWSFGCVIVDAVIWLL
jgi:serine/threonine protein kinase